MIRLFRKKKEEDEFDIEEEIGEDLGEEIEEIKREKIEITPPVERERKTEIGSYEQQIGDLRIIEQKIDMLRFDMQRLSQRIDFLIQRIDYLITLIQQKLYG